MAWLGVLDSTHNNNRRRAERAACSQQQQREKCLREVPGVTGAFLIYLRHQRTDPGKKNNDGSGCRSAAHGTADPDGTGWDGRRKECQLCDEKHNNTTRIDWPWKQQLCGCVGWPGVGASSTTQQLQNHGRIWHGKTLTAKST